VGPYGTREKDVALSISRELKTLIDKQIGMRAVLLRDGDYFISLRGRMRKARANNADLFISIHADGFKDKKASGASVFVLSSNKASSRSASWIANSENMSDLVGGINLDDKTDVLSKVLIDLSQYASYKASLKLADRVLKSIAKITNLHADRVESANFFVLRAPDIPSILVETGFISNPTTEKKLRDKAYQKKIANAILQGVKDYHKYKPH